MKDILIAERLNPFSHEAGTFTLLPGSALPIQIFPTLIRFYRFEMGILQLMKELQMELEGPVEEFTVTNDLEKGRISISGKEKRGWIRIHLTSSQDLKSVRFLADRFPQEGLKIFDGSQTVVLKKNEPFDLWGPVESLYYVPPFDRLSFGCHKSQDWEKIRIRKELKEIFPFWHRLGQMIPQNPLPKKSEMLSLFEACKKERNEKSWLQFFMCGYTGILVPQNHDCLYQGIIQNKMESSDSPLWILSEGSRLIRELFILQEEKIIFILPSLLPSLPFGKLTHVSLKGVGLLSLEWSKKTVRRMTLHASYESEIELAFPSSIKTYRLRSNKDVKGEQKDRSKRLSLQPNTTYFFDHFQ